MKNQNSLLFLAAGLAGVAAIALSNVALLAAVSGEIVMAVVTSSALLAFAISDYSRQPKPLGLRTALARPPVTPVPVERPAVKRAAAYGIRRAQPALVEHSAA